jgi:hypothetical protein
MELSQSYFGSLQFYETLLFPHSVLADSEILNPTYLQGSVAHVPSGGPFIATNAFSESVDYQVSAELVSSKDMKPSVLNPSSVPQGSDIFTKTDAFTLSEEFNITDVFEVTPVILATVILPSAKILRTPALLATPAFLATSTYLATSVFQASSKFLASQVFMASQVFPATQSRVLEQPVATLEIGESWSVSLILETYSETVSAYEVQTDTVTVFITRGDSYTIIADSASLIRDITFATQAATKLTSIAYQPVVIPVYRTTGVRIKLNNDQPTVIPKGQASNALVIGVATGAGLLVALLAAAFVFVVRHARQKAQASSSLEDNPNHYEAVDIMNKSRDVEDTPPPESDDDVSLEKDSFLAPTDLAGTAGELDLGADEPASMTEQVWI